MIPLTDLRNRDLKAVRDNRKGITAMNPVVINQAMFASNEVIGSNCLCVALSAQSQRLSDDNCRTMQMVPAAKIRNTDMETPSDNAKRITAANAIGVDRATPRSTTVVGSNNSCPSSAVYSDHLPSDNR